MSSTDDGQFDHGNSMSAAADIETANTLLGRLELIEAHRQGVSLREARRAIARHVRTLPGTLENLRRLRLKTVPSWLMARIRAELVVALQHQARQLEHEIHVHIQAGTHPRSDDLAKAQAQLVEAKKILMEP